MNYAPRTLALLTAAAFTLTGCSALLEQEYTHITPHNAAPTAEGDPSTLRADSYQELVNALIYLISTSTQQGTIRLYSDTPDLDADLEAACLEVVQEDPLGAYAVEYITYSITPVVSYYEAVVDITYRRSKEQVASIVQATGVTAIRSQLSSAMSVFKTECVLRISYFDKDEAFIQSLARQAYYNSPASAFGMPTLQVALYPASGQQRIVEILLTYPYEAGELEKKEAALIQWLDELSGKVIAVTGDRRYLDVAQAICDTGSYDPQGGSLVCSLSEDGKANSEGFALAMGALCQHIGLSCRVMDGTVNGQPHFWNIIQTEDGWRHLDLTVSQGPSFPLATDQEMSDLGYSWDTNLYPASTADSEAAN